MFKILSGYRNRFLVLSVLVYAVVFHVAYNIYWKAPRTQRTTSTHYSWQLPFWNSLEGYEEENLLDVHIEDPELGHTGETLMEDKRHNRLDPMIGKNSIAIGGGITSKGVLAVNETNIETKFQLFHTFIPTFCETASPGFDYHFYFSYDSIDNMFKQSNFLWAFQKAFLNATSVLCPRNVITSIHMIQCSHAGKPTWAQNDAMLEAYLDNVEYYYRINDDTRMKTKNWTESFIRVLRGYDPPNVGVVGPNHSGGNTAILTYDFVHRTHLDIFGFYYPRLFSDWWGDDWVTKVYRPDRSTKLEHVRLDHTLGLGQRYGVNWAVGAKLQGQLDKDMTTLKRYIKKVRSRDSVKVDGRKVIAMSLFGKNPLYSWGAIRNAQLVPIIFPEWKLRIYVTSRSSKAENVKSWFVPQRILNKLKQLGAELAYVKTKSIPPIYWRYLVIDDDNVDHFLIRNAQSRLSERDAAAVNDWLQNQNQSALHCIRDHPKHANQSIVDGLWGGNRAEVRRILGQDMAILLGSFHHSVLKTTPDKNLDLLFRLAKSYRHSSETNDTISVLSDVIWPLVTSSCCHVYCHDSVSCNEWPNANAFPVARVPPKEYVGQEFDQHQEPISQTGDEHLANVPLKCQNAGHIMTTNTELTNTTTYNSTTTKPLS